MKLRHKLPAQKSPISHFVKEIPAFLEVPGDLGALGLVSSHHLEDDQPFARNFPGEGIKPLLRHRI